MCLWPSNPFSVFAFYTQFPVPCVSNRILTYYFNKNHFRKHFLLISFFILAWETRHKMLGKAEKFKDQVDVIAAFSFFLSPPQTVHTPAQGETDISDIYRCDLAESSIARWHRAGRWHSTCAGGQEILMGRGRGQTSMKQWDAEKQRCWRTQTAVSSRETSLSSAKTQRWPARRQNSGMTMGVQACMLLE